MTGFSAVFTGNFVVAQAGNYTINVFSQDGFIFGVGNGATSVSGVNINPPANGITVFSQPPNVPIPVMSANNGPSSGASTPIVVAFPTAGSYPYEFDYKSGTGGPLAFTVTVGQGAAATGVGPLESLVLTSNTASPVAGQQASFTVKATDETGAPIKSLPVTVNVVGGAPRTLNATTNAAGIATVSYTEIAPMTDLLQASALVNGLQLVSAQTTVTWAAPSQAPQAPLITVNGDKQLQLPSTGSYTASVTDPAAPAGGAISVNWTQTGGPAAVTFSASQQLATTVTFPATGVYMLQITATDSLGSRSMQVGPITVTAPQTITVATGWLGSPADNAQVTGLVPITVASGVTLASGTLSYYPTANPSASLILNSSTTGSGTLATLDTTLLANGSYYILLNATDSTGKSMLSGVDILVGGDYKPGRVTTTVTDLVVPAPGLPIQISRTYDSLVRGTSADFGYGWTLGVNVQLDVAANYDVTLTINGQRRTFYFTPYVPGFYLDGIAQPNLLGVNFPAYTPEPGMFGTLSVWSNGSSMMGSNTGCLFDWLLPYGNSYFCYDNAGTYSPGGYVYTDPYGRVYTISSTGGLQSVQDVAGNAINITPSGITSTNGLNVPFVRDSQGRITQIVAPLDPTDPNSPQDKTYTYAYDANGNLASVTYPVNPAHLSDPNNTGTPVAQYTYNATDTHLYASGTDPRGNQLPTTTYDSNGRLQTVTLHPYSDPTGNDPTKSYKTSYSYATTPVTVSYPDGTTASGLTTTVTNPDNTTVTQVYDSYGMLLSSTDPLGNTTLNKYDAYHNLVSVTDPLGHTNTYTYDSNGNKLSSTYPQPTPNNPVNTTSYTTYNAYSEPSTTTDELGNPRSFAYDSNFWPQLASDSIGPVVSFTFNANGTMASKAVGYDLTQTPAAATKYTYDQYGNLQSQTDPIGNLTTYTYDNLGRKTSMTPPAPAAATTYTYDALGNLLTVTVSGTPNRVTHYTYDMNGNKTSETDPNGNTTTYTYDGLNRLTLVTYPTTPQTTTKYTYDFRNNVIDTTDQTNHITHNDYFANGWLKDLITTSDVPADARTTSYTYYNDGRKASETDPRGNITNYVYDPAGRLISVTAGYNTPQATTTTYAYDAAGNQTSVTDGKGQQTQSAFDARRRLLTTTYADSTTTQYSYDGPGNLALVTDQAKNQVQYTYDFNNQLKTVVQVNAPDSSHNTTAYGYDTNGNLTSLEDANTHTTQNGFDVFNQLHLETMPAGQSQTRTYDAAGNLQTLLDYNGKTTTYTYDSMNRLLSRQPDQSLTDAPEIFTYTPTGKRATMTDASGITTYIYDDHDRLSQKQTPQGTLTYTYDSAGNVASMTSSNTNGVSVAYTYDNLNRLETVVDNRLVGQQTTTCSYDPASNLATVTYPNGLQSTFTYDTQNRVTALSNAAASYTYTLDGTVGNRTGVTEKLAKLPGARIVGWNYDGIYRLTTENISADPNSRTGEVTYGFDPVGNRLSLGLSQGANLPGISPIQPGSISYDPDDRLSTETYDANGNTLTTGGKTFAYDFENRLKSMNAGAVTIQYDADGNRVAKTMNGATTRYLVDDLNPTGYPQVVEEVTGTTASRTYTYGLQRISQNQQITSAWTPSFYGYDGGGTVRLLTDSTSTVTDTYDYDAWGNEVNTTGSTPNVYLYRGEQYDSDLGLYYLRARYFNPVTGRFLATDPAEGAVTDPTTLHKYLYASADPVNQMDPTGWAAGGAVTPEAGGYLHFLIGPLTWFKSVILSKPVDFCTWFGNGPSGGPGGAPRTGHSRSGPWHPPLGTKTKCTDKDSCAAVRGKIALLATLIGGHIWFDFRHYSCHDQDINQYGTQMADCLAMAIKACGKSIKIPYEWIPRDPIIVIDPCILNPRAPYCSCRCQMM
jgi:RHS repeat-associated protein